MIRGINPKADNYKDIRQMLSSLKEIWESNEPQNVARKMTYEQFILDPFSKQ